MLKISNDNSPLLQSDTEQPKSALVRNHPPGQIGSDQSVNNSNIQLGSENTNIEPLIIKSNANGNQTFSSNQRTQESRNLMVKRLQSTKVVKKVIDYQEYNDNFDEVSKDQGKFIFMKGLS